MSSPKVIVFGPTGNVGLPTSLTAATLGAKVYLAMRDTTKPLLPPGSATPILTPSEETALGLERIQADFSSPSSVTSAILTTGAKHAFIYIFDRSPAGLASVKGSIKAMKSAGVEFVVLLSSGSIPVEQDLQSIPPEQMIEYAHAQVELALEETFGKEGFVAVRPAYFASNIMWWRGMVGQGEIVTVGPELKFDWVVPEDIGRVAGTILAKGPAIFETVGRENGPVYLFGPEMVSLTEAMGILGDVLGRDIKVTSVGLEEAVKAMVEVNGFPEFMARTILSVTEKHISSGDPGALYKGVSYEEGRGNHELFTGRKATVAREYLEGVKGVFA